MEEKSNYRYFKIGEFDTVGELKELLNIYPDDMELGFINQQHQDLYIAIQKKDSEVIITHLGFQ